MKTDKFFADALTEFMSKNKITKIKLAEESDISRAYLTQIIVHNVLPSKEIIEKISNALKIKPNYFREYRVLEIIEDMEKYYWMLKEDDVEQFKKITSKIKSRKFDPDRQFDKLTSKREVGFKPDYIISLTDLQKDQIKIIRTIVDKYREMNKKNSEDANASYNLYMDFTQSPEYDEWMEEYSELADDDTGLVPFAEEYIEKYKKRLLKEKKDKS